MALGRLRRTSADLSCIQLWLPTGYQRDAKTAKAEEADCKCELLFCRAQVCPPLQVWLLHFTLSQQRDTVDQDERNLCGTTD